MKTTIKLVGYFAPFALLPILPEEGQLFMLMCGIPAYCVMYLMLFVRHEN